MGVKPNLIEILTKISGVTFDDVLDAHRVIDVGGRRVCRVGCRAGP